MGQDIGELTKYNYVTRYELHSMLHAKNVRSQGWGARLFFRTVDE